MATLPQIRWIILAFVSVLLAISVTSLDIAVIGAGAAGIVSAKNAHKDGHNVTVYEQTGEIGGIWVYTDEVGKDQYGVPIHTPMYQGLR